MTTRAGNAGRSLGTGRPAASPQAADPLDKPVQFVRGVGPHRAPVLAELGIDTVGDLICHFPFRFEEQGKPQPIDSLRLDEPATILGVVERVRWHGGGGRFAKAALRAEVMDSTGRARATWFNMPYLRERIQRGQLLRLHGKVGVDGDIAWFANPAVEWLDPDADPATWNTQRIIPVYPATEKLTSGQIARLIEQELDSAVRYLAEPLTAEILGRRALPARRWAIRTMHRPTDLADLGPARRRLAYEELLLMQLAIALQRRWTADRGRAPRLPTTQKIDQRIRRRFPFALTPAQDRAVAQIAADLDRTRPMTRLLQGDVGSGKTVVALYAALVTVANRHQCAILAPTEVLAAQHYASIEKYLAGSRVRRCLLTGSVPRGQREQHLRAIAAGQMDLVVGTQALLEKRIRFASLGLVIVDEQHKFGVSQRATLKGARLSGRAPAGADSRQFLMPHYLVMTATPIPRTLSMTVFGDLDVSIIDALPPGRQLIVTRLVSPAEEREAWPAVRRRIAQGDQVYVVYPLVEESEALDLKAATAEVEHVARDLLPAARVGLLHGRLNKHDKQSAMEAFKAGRLDVLVCTTVIEVGVDVPNATVMVVQHAERYGLAALHQLRGRVGRGAKPSACLLMSESAAGPAYQRLKVLCETTDGFRIAEEDLKMRGPGELLGTRQHGFPELKVANLIEDTELLTQARDDAADIVARDGRLLEPAHQALRAELRRRFRDKVAFIDVA